MVKVAAEIEKSIDQSTVTTDTDIAERVTLQRQITVPIPMTGGCACAAPTPAVTVLDHFLIMFENLPFLSIQTGVQFGSISFLAG